MKKTLKTVLFSFVIILFGSGAQSLHAQEIKSIRPELKVEFKRCIQSSDGHAFIDITLTNRSNEAMYLTPWEFGFRIWDDEGNVYESRGDQIYYAEGSTLAVGKPRYSIPAGITQKKRIVVKNGFDKYAAVLTLLQIETSCTKESESLYSSPHGNIEIRNIPITRE